MQVPRGAERERKPMAITYTEEQRELVKLVRDVARNEVMPYVAAADKAGECPRELYQWGFDLGLHMVEIPEQFGGMGLSYETCAMMFEELAWVDAAYADTFVTNFVAFRNILLNGTEEQARHFVEKTENNGFAAFCLTEANAGSDGRRHAHHGGARRRRVRPERDEDLHHQWLHLRHLRGVRQERSGSRRHGSRASSSTATPGPWLPAPRSTRWASACRTTTEVVLENVRVPRSAVIGEVGCGMSIALNALNLSRAFISTLAVASCSGRSTRPWPTPSSASSSGGASSTSRWCRLCWPIWPSRPRRARVLVNNCMRQMDAGEMVRKDGAIVKTFVTDAMQEVVSNAVQVLGGYGYSEEYPVEKLMRDAKIFQIFEGSNQIQRMTIAKELDREYR